MDNLNLNKNNEPQHEEDIELSFEEIINAASGLSADGQPATAGNIMISRLVEEGVVKNDEEASFGTAVIDFFASGGCMVVQADFPMKDTKNFEKIADICSTYMTQVGNEAWHENRDLIAIMVPLAFYGDISIVLQDLVYFTAINLENNGTRLIMCFNNMMTQLVENEDIDYNKIVLEARNQEMREEDKLRNDLQMAEDKLKDLENQENSYAMNVTQGFAHQSLLNKEFETQTEESHNSPFRHSDDE